MHKHGRHNTEAIFSSVVIRIHLFKSILGGTGEHWIFQVDHISPAMGKKKKKRRNFCNRPNSRPAKWRKWEKQTTGPRFAPRGRWFSLCVFGVTHCDIVTGNREVLQQKPIYVSQLTQTIRTRSSDWQQVAASSLVSRRCVPILSIREELMQRFT